MEETGVSEENHRPLSNDYQTFSHNVVPSAHRMSRVQIRNISGIMH